jgi:tetratricopeptide (TPR) repeat protein
VPDLPIIDIARNEVQVAVGPAGATELAAADPRIPEDHWQRMNDYGIALLLEGNTRGAMEAFQHVAQIAPQRPDGNRNYARAAHAEGLLPAAYEGLRKAEALAPGDAPTAWVWGQVLAEDGRYDEAAAALRRVLQQFPDDRSTWRDLSIVYYRNQQLEESLTAAAEVLRIDPEDRVAHYYRMLAYKALGRTVETEIARLAYEKYQIDESAQEMTQALRLSEPGDNLESQPVHVHRLELKSAAGAGAASGATR